MANRISAATVRSIASLEPEQILAPNNVAVLETNGYGGIVKDARAWLAARATARVTLKARVLVAQFYARQGENNIEEMENLFGQLCSEELAEMLVLQLGGAEERHHFLMMAHRAIKDAKEWRSKVQVGKKEAKLKLAASS